jgi:hypothetical protein
MAKPPLNRKPRVVPPDGYDPDPPTPDSSVDWAPLEDHMKLAETKISFERTTNKDGVTTTAITFARRTASAMRRVGIPQLPPKNWKDALVGGAASLLTAVSLANIVLAYMAKSGIGTANPLIAGTGLSVLALMTIAGRRK